MAKRNKEKKKSFLSKILGKFKKRESLHELARKATQAQIDKIGGAQDRGANQALFQLNLKKLKKGTFDPKSVSNRK